MAKCRGLGLNQSNKLASMNEVTAIIQARMSSSRLPGKVLLDLGGVPVLAHVINRLRKTKVDQIVVATSTNTDDNDIAALAKCLTVDIFRGNLTDVLDRYYQASLSFPSTYILRITADCPLLDPCIVNSLLERGISGAYDFYSLAPSAPDGLDCTLLSRFALHAAYHEALLPSEREHVAPFIEKQPTRFRNGYYDHFPNEDLGHLRLTLDEPSDYSLLTELSKVLPPNDYSFCSVYNALMDNPSLLSLNSHIVRNEGYINSLKMDLES